MRDSRCECSWCHEIVSVMSVSRTTVGACTGQPSHAAHALIENHSAVRSPMPFENERRFPRGDLINSSPFPSSRSTQGNAPSPRTCGHPRA